MRHLLIILISILLLSSPVIGEETGVLYLWENGTKYMGEWKDGIKHGQGTYTYLDGKNYVGEFRNGKFNGQGTYIYGIGKLKGEKYEGEWKNGERTGPGTYTWSNGDKYVGEYKDEKPWNGTYYDKDGNIKGKYVNGVKQ